MKRCFIVLTCIFLYTCEDIIEVEDISESQVTVLAPLDNSVISTSNIIFSWQTLEFAENYQLQIATPNFSEAIQILEDTIVSTTSFSKVLENGDYQWRVKALNSAYQTQYQTQTFSIEN